jgi:hypothetical protein
MRLWDENRVLYKTDTTGVKIILTYPCALEDCESDSIIYFSSNEVEWLPATDTSDFTVLFQPANLPDGAYTLTVDMSDGHGNASGNEPYSITFEVNSESSIVLLAPYPNPSAELFTFTLVISGVQPPNQFSIEVFSLDGRKVSDLQNLNAIIGRNEITWNGMNINGSRLPAGVYFYRIILRDNGKDVAVKVPANTSYFNKGYGKLVLTR